MTSPDFDLDSQLQPIGDIDETRQPTNRTWSGRLSANWSIGSVPNGGYSGGVLLRGLLAHTGCEAALSLTTHYYRPTIANAALEVQTDVLRRGRSTTHADGVLIQDGKVRLRTTGVFGATPSGETRLPVSPQEIPRPEDCPERDPQAQGLDMSLMQSLEVRLHPEHPLPIDDSTARVEGWIRFRDNRPNDALALCLFADSFPPAILSAVPEAGWVPTIEMTSHTRAAAAPGWIRGRITTSNVSGGYLVEDVRLWDTTGKVVVDARQLALLRV